MYIVLRHSLAVVGMDNDLWLGVEFFFILSGFLLVVKYREQENVFDFLLRKYCRFAPLVTFGYLLCMFVRPYGPLSFIANVLLMSETGSITPSGAFDPPTWYLSVLLWGGVVLFMIIKYIKSRWLIISVGVMLGLAYLRKYGYEEMLSENVPDLIIPHRFIRGITEMGLGCVVGKFFLSDSSWFAKKPSVFRSIIYWMVFVSALSAPLFSMRQNNGCISLLLFMFCALVFFFAKGDNLFNRPLWGKFSRYALAVFTTHYFTTYLLIKFDSCYTGDSAYLAVISAILISLVIGVISYHFVEVPANKALARFWSKEEHEQEHEQ
jgi:peptidoglycan/LPS O-acetylase OafA/YrhL